MSDSNGAFFNMTQLQKSAVESFVKFFINI